MLKTWFFLIFDLKCITYENFSRDGRGTFFFDRGTDSAALFFTVRGTDSAALFLKMGSRPSTATPRPSTLEFF